LESCTSVYDWNALQARYLGYPSAPPTAGPSSFPPGNRALGQPVRLRLNQLPTAILTAGPTAFPTTATPTFAPTPSFGLMGFDYGKTATLSKSNFDCMYDNGFEFFLQRGYVTFRSGRPAATEVRSVLRGGGIIFEARVANLLHRIYGCPRVLVHNGQ
jgi:hypothetical protein